MTESYIEVLDILTYLRDTESDVSVRFQGDESPHPSVITALNAKHQTMVIERIPSINSAELQRGTPAILSAQKEGRTIDFNSRFMEPLVPGLDLGYQLEIPEYLGTTQPRAAFRVLLDGIRDKVKITLASDEGQPINGIVRNISKLGLGMRTEASLPQDLAQTSQMVDCKILLQEADEIACKMEIRNIKSLSNGRSETFIGGRMLDISRRDNSVLSQFIEQLQRERMESFA